MSNKFAVIGGDLRIVKLANILAKDGNIVYRYGQEKAAKNVNVIDCKTLEQAIENTKNIICPIPFSTNNKEINSPFSEEKITIQELLEKSKNKMLFAGSISKEVYELSKNQNIEIIDVMEREELAILNSIATAEGTIKVLIENTEEILQGKNILIIGFGRITKVLSKKLEALSCSITCSARKKEDLAWIKAYGYKAINSNSLKEELADYNIVINTVPSLILNKENLQYIKKGTLLVDLASKPGGIDREEAEKRDLKVIWALALPGKVAPTTTAEIIIDTIYNIQKERRINK